ncbi:MAG: endolytic transglycosylase MltG [Streptosporangiaceae bacterium]
MSRGGYDRFDDQQDTGSLPRGARRRSRGRTDEQHAAPGADEPYGYTSPGHGSAGDQAGSDGYGRGYGGDGYQADGGYPQVGDPSAGYGDGHTNDYAQDGSGQDGSGQDSYGQHGSGQGGYGQDRSGQHGYGQDSYGQNSYGQDRSGQHGYGQHSSGQDSYGQHGSGQGGYGQDSYGQHGSGQDSYGQDSYGQGGSGQGGYGQDRSGQGGYGQDRSGQHAYGQDGYGQESYRRDGYADDGYGGAGYREDGYRGGDYADDRDGRSAGSEGSDSYPARDPYAARDPYPAPDPYGAQDPYVAGDQYGSRDAAARTDPRDSGRHGRTDPRGMTDPGGSTDPYRRGRDPYEPAESPAPGYGGRDADGEAARYGGHDGYGGQERYGSPAGYEPGGGYDEPDERYAWDDARDRRDGPDGASASRPSTASVSDPDMSRHEGFFRGFGQDDDLGGRRSGKDRKGRKDRKEHRSHAGLIALLVVLVIIAGVAGVGYHFYSEYKSRHASYTGSGFGSVTVIVKSGDTPDLIGPQLLRLHVIESIDPWDAYVVNKSGLQPGEFKLHEHMSPAAAWALLTNPKVKVNSTVTIPDGLVSAKILPLLAKKSGIPISQFETAFKDTAALGLPAYANGSAEGYLYPDTYDIVPGSTTALQILQAAVHQFTVEAGSLNLVAAAQAAQFTPAQVITEASLLEAEVGPQYYADVARVIDNRLNQSPPWDLQLDSTIAYATGDYSYNFTVSQLHVNSPYNTFTNAGLPPGPIDSPDAAAIQAVLHPAPSSNNWLYFVTINKSGTTDFTNSSAQFQTWSNEAKQNGV